MIYYVLFLKIYILNSYIYKWPKINFLLSCIGIRLLYLGNKQWILFHSDLVIPCTVNCSPGAESSRDNEFKLQRAKADREVTVHLL